MSRRAAFSLVELLVVMAIISVLAAMLLPSLQQSIKSARVIQCAGNMRQLGMGNSIYVAEFSDWMPIIHHTLGYNLATASQLYSIGAKCSPYWLDLWPRGVRVCPTIPDKGYEGVPYNWGPQQNDVDLLYGYDLPQTSQYITRRYMWPRVADAFPGTGYGAGGTNDGGMTCEYVRLRPAYARYYWNAPPAIVQGSLWTIWGGKPFDLLDVVPMVSDMDHYDVVNKKGVAAHAGVSGKFFGSAPAIAEGKNALWRDGHVEWHALGVPSGVTQQIHFRLQDFGGTGWAQGSYGEVSAFWYKPGKRE